MTLSSDDHKNIRLLDGQEGSDECTAEEIAEVEKLLDVYQRDLERRADSPELQRRLEERLRRRFEEIDSLEVFREVTVDKRISSPVRCGAPLYQKTGGGLPLMLHQIVLGAKRLQLLDRMPPLLRALHRLRAREIRRAKGSLRRQLKGELAALMKQHGAMYGLLFLKVSDRVLRAVATLHTALPNYSMPIDGHGVVPYIAREQRCERLPNERWSTVRACPYYKDAIEETQSLLAVPIRTHEGRLLGVLDLESPNPRQFPEGSQDRLQEQVQRLVPKLLCLEAILVPTGLFTWPWYPRLTKGDWPLTEAFESVCDALARAVGPDKARVTVWNADWEKRVLFPLGTSLPYDEYLTCALPGTSKTYEAAAGKGAWVYADPRAPDFYDRDAAPTGGLSDMYVAKVCKPEAGHASNSTLPLGTCNLYLYDNDTSQVIDFSGRELAQAASLIGEMYASHRALRRAVARAYLENQLDAPSAGRTSYQIVRDTIAECLDADGCTVLLYLGTEHKLLCVATTGLVLRDEEEHVVIHSPGNRHTEEYDLSEVSIMTFVADHPGMVVRKNNLMDNQEPGVPVALPPADFSKKLVDDIPTKDRRFMAMSVAPAGETLAVVRVVRPMDRPPFTADDADDLQSLMDIWGSRLLTVERFAQDEDELWQRDIGGEGGEGLGS
jgi:hypothetical protein